jgi:hypothetical protein
VGFGAFGQQVAVARAVSISQHAGVRALLVHTLHDHAKQFYAHYGFQESSAASDDADAALERYRGLTQPEQTAIDISLDAQLTRPCQ